MIRFKHTFKKNGKFKSWLFQIARNEFADHYRKKSTGSLENTDYLVSKEDPVDIQWARDEREKLLYIALYRLNIDQFRAGGQWRFGLSVGLFTDQSRHQITG